MSQDLAGERAERRVVFDCNLFLQAVGKGGNHAYRCLRLVVSGEFVLCMSEPVLAEIDEVLRRPIVRKHFPMLDDDRVGELIAWIREIARFYDPVPHVFDYPVDPKDEPYIDWAIEAGAVFLVSWDKHLIRLGMETTTEGARFKKLYPQIVVSDPKSFLKNHFR